MFNLSGLLSGMGGGGQPGAPQFGQFAGGNLPRGGGMGGGMPGGLDPKLLMMMRAQQALQGAGDSLTKPPDQRQKPQIDPMMMQMLMMQRGGLLSGMGGGGMPSGGLY